MAKICRVKLPNQTANVAHQAATPQFDVQAMTQQVTQAVLSQLSGGAAVFVDGARGSGKGKLNAAGVSGVQGSSNKYPKND